MQIPPNLYISVAPPLEQKNSGEQNIVQKGSETAIKATEINQRNYDFTNISRKEFNALWKSGEIDIDFPPLILPEGGLDITKDTKAQADAVYENKINFIEYFEKAITYQKTLPSTEANKQALEHYERGLSSLVELQGKARQPSIDIQA